jgi:uncharacterized caspase-like protein
MTDAALGDEKKDLHFAVVVGINRYPGIRNLKRARNDAKAFKKWLVSPDGGGLPAKNVKHVWAEPQDEQTFRRPSDSWPTSTQVNRALESHNDAMDDRLDADPTAFDRSRLYLYASGHGIAPGGGKGAVLMADADEARGRLGYNIELSLYETWYLGWGRFSEVVIFADCCRDRVFAAPGMGPPWDNSADRFGNTKTVLGFASTFGSSAFEPSDVPNPNTARGYFTQALLDGLWGAAADPATGEIDTTRLSQYVSESVRALTDGKKIKQETNMPVDVGKPIVFRPRGSKIVRRPTRQVTVRFPPGFKRRVALRRGDLSTDQTWSGRDGDWKLDLDEGFYSVVLSPSGKPGPFNDNGVFKVIAMDRDVQL